MKFCIAEARSAESMQIRRQHSGSEETYGSPPSWSPAATSSPSMVSISCGDELCSSFVSACGFLFPIPWVTFLVGSSVAISQGSSLFVVVICVARLSPLNIACLHGLWDDATSSMVVTGQRFATQFWTIRREMHVYCMFQPSRMVQPGDALAITDNEF